jgi:hypothetical protein
MMSSGECRTKAAEASARAETITDPSFRAHYEAMAADWAALAVTALAQEVMEADIVGRENFSAG